MPKLLTIGINTLFLIPNEVGGTEYYTRSFLAQLEKQDIHNLYVVFCNQENYDTFQFESTRWKKVLCQVSAKNRVIRIIYEQIMLPLLAKASGCTVLHSFGYLAPAFPFVPSVVTVHDANWKDHPEDISWFAGKIMNILMSTSLKSVQKIITDSQFSQQRLVHHYPHYKKKIEVVEPGIDEGFLTLLKKKQLLPKGIKQPYFLCVSGLYPHKRVPYLLELWELLKREFPRHSLIIVGKNGADSKLIKKKIEESSRVKLLEKVPFSELVGLYQNSELFLFPSVYEGFGFPVYEACAAGKSVIVGNKQCYSTSLQSSLEEFTFDLHKDVAQIKKMTLKKITPRATESYAKKTQKLLALYRSLS